MLLTTCVLFLTYTCVAVSSQRTVVVPHTGDQDDTPGLLAALPSCTSDCVILFQNGTSYNLFTPVRFPVLRNVEIRIEGNLTYPDSIPQVQGV